jgi:hypothetical protein
MDVSVGAAGVVVAGVDALPPPPPPPQAVSSASTGARMRELPN